MHGLDAIQGTEAPDTVRVEALDTAGGTKTFEAVVRIDTPAEVAYYLNGGILPFMLRRLLAQ